MSEEIYKINYRKLVTWLVPVPLRGLVTMAWLVAIISPFVDLYNTLLRLRDAALYTLTITPQVVYLERMLNDRYDRTQRRIYILDGREYSPLFIYRRAEIKPVFLFRKSEANKSKQYLFTKGETGQFTFDFVVYVPSDVTYDLNEITSLINNYKLASKVFTIQKV